MTDLGHVDLVDDRDVADLTTFLARAGRLGATAVRLQASGEVLGVTVCALAGHGLMGEGTVLGLRAFALAQAAACDVVVGMDAVHDRLARMRSSQRHPVSGGPDAAVAGPGEAKTRRLALPRVPVVEPWAGLAPPRQGWQHVGQVGGDVVEQVATAGIAEVAAAHGGDIRDMVWRRPVPGTEVPAGVALAVHALGFTAPELTVFTHGRWVRVSSPAGHVLAR